VTIPARGLTKFLFVEYIHITSSPTARCCLVPPAVGRRCAPTRGRRPKGRPTGGRTEQASNIARGTPGDRRTCGYRTSDPVRHRAASAPRGAEVRGSVTTPASRAPSDFHPEPRRERRKTKGRRPAPESFKPPGREALASVPLASEDSQIGVRMRVCLYKQDRTHPGSSRRSGVA